MVVSYLESSNFQNFYYLFLSKFNHFPVLFIWGLIDLGSGSFNPV